MPDASLSAALSLDLAWLSDATPLMAPAYWAAHGIDAATPPRGGSVVHSADAGAPSRLGRWFERVHLAALQEQPSVEVLAANLPLRAGGRTLGELDVLYRSADAVVHREVAVKFYLATGTSCAPEAWIGPGKRDRLDLKLGRFVEHQTRVPTLAREHGVWPEALPFPTRREVLLLGMLFSHSSAPRLPDGAHEDAAHGRWYTAAEFSGRFGADPWCVLDKPWWLSPEHAHRMPSVPAHALAEGLETPRLAARVHEGAVERAFVVPNGW